MQFNKYQLIVFPTSRSIREFIQENKNTNQLLPKYCTIGDFFSNVISIGSKHYCEDELRILYLKEAIESIDLSSLGMNSSLNSLLKQSDYLFRFFAELTHENKTIQELHQYDTYAFYQDHLDKLQLIFDRYTEVLRSNNGVDKITLPFEYELNTEYISQFEQIEILYEGYFSAYEFNLLKQIASQVLVNIKFTLTAFNQKNKTIFNTIGIDLEKNGTYTIDLSNQKIIEDLQIVQNTKTVEIQRSNQRLSQIGFIKYQIVQMVQNGIDPDKIIVVLPDESFYKHLQTFNEERYFNFAMGNSIENSLFIQTLEALYKILSDFEPYDSDKIEKYNLSSAWLFDTLLNQMNKNLQQDTFDQIIEFVMQYETRSEVIQKVEIVLLKLKKLFFNSQIQVTLKEGLKILIQRLKQITIDDVMGGKITVMGLLETRLLKPQGVIVIDFNDHIIPKRSVKDKFISTQIKQLVGLPTSKDREDLQKYYYHRLFDNAQSVAISFVEDEQSGLSRFAYELFDSKILHAIETLPYETILTNNILHTKSNDEIIKQIDLSAQEWSATSLKTYLQCKRKYYYQYVMKIKEHYASIKPQGFELGDILHKALYSVYSNNYALLTKEQFKEKLYGYIDALSRKNPYLLLEIEIWKRKLDRFVENEYKRFEARIKPFEFEKDFKFIYNNIRIKGVIDRIDRNGDFVEVLDYKTSSSLKIDSANNFHNSVDFQLEFYYLAAQQWFKNQTINCFYYDLNKAVLKEEKMLDEKLLLLDEIFKELHTQEVNFEKCEDKNICEYCIYKVMCGR